MCHDFYRIRPIGDINDSVFHYPYFLLFMGPFLITFVGSGPTVFPMLGEEYRIIYRPGFIQYS